MSPRAVGLLAAVALLPGCPSSRGERPTLQLKGSDTMLHLANAWAEDYMAAHPEAELTVTGGGSGVGVSALLEGGTDLAMASRPLKAEEAERAAGRDPRAFVVARDGIGLVVNRANPVDALTLDQLRQIFNGTLERWSQVGGPDEPIQVLSRESSSGTFVFFNERVMQGDDYAPDVRRMPSSAAIVKTCVQDAWSIGYVGLGYAEGGDVKLLAVKTDDDAEGVTPSRRSVEDGAYPICRPLRLYTLGEPSGLAEAFLGYVRSGRGQEVVARKGYVPIEPEARGS